MSLIFAGPTFPENKSPRKTAVAYLDKAEIEEMRNAIQNAHNYILKAASTPPQNQEEMDWKSIEGVTIAAGFSKGNPVYYASAPVHNGDDSDTVGISLKSEDLDLLMTKIQAALNSAGNSKK